MEEQKKPVHQPMAWTPPLPHQETFQPFKIEYQAYQRLLRDQQAWQFFKQLKKIKEYELHKSLRDYVGDVSRLPF